MSRLKGYEVVVKLCSPASNGASFSTSKISLPGQSICTLPINGHSKQRTRETQGRHQQDGGTERKGKDKNSRCRNASSGSDLKRGKPVPEPSQTKEPSENLSLCDILEWTLDTGVCQILHRSGSEVGGRKAAMLLASPWSPDLEANRCAAHLA